MTETDDFFLAAAAEHIERCDGKEHACPLPTIKTLAEDNKRAEQSQHGTGGVDRPYDRDRKMFDGIIAQYPRRQYNKGFQNDKPLLLPLPVVDTQHRFAAKDAGMRGYDEGKKYQRTKQRVAEKHRDNGIFPQRVFFCHVVKPKKCRRQKSETQPHKNIVFILRKGITKVNHINHHSKTYRPNLYLFAHTAAKKRRFITIESVFITISFLS